MPLLLLVPLLLALMLLLLLRPLRPQEQSPFSLVAASAPVHDLLGSRAPLQLTQVQGQAPTTRDACCTPVAQRTRVPTATRAPTRTPAYTRAAPPAQAHSFQAPNLPPPPTPSPTPLAGNAPIIGRLCMPGRTLLPPGAHGGGSAHPLAQLALCKPGLLARDACHAVLALVLDV